MNDYRVELKAIFAQTIKVTAEDEDGAIEKALEGDGEIITDFEWHEAHETEHWKITET